MRRNWEEISFKLNGLTNLYTLFLLKSIYQLNENGRAAFIIPSEFLNSDFGKLIKSYLIKSKTLRHIAVINFKENVFNDALTTSAIILCANDNKSGKVQFSNVSSQNDFSNIERVIKSYPDYLSNERTVGI
ncbi:MAG: N-6 DNA methylase [Ignavibacteria bacterium]|nr:N-6 DNA methylase [Ignavibacteria bacterium]